MAKKQTPTQEELPILTSLGFMKQDGLWKTYKLHTQGDKVVNAEVFEGDTRLIAFEKFKLEAAKEFLDKDLV